MKVLHLTLKKQWYDMIVSGEKKEEYREIKPYWVSRLMYNDLAYKSFVGILFINGYSGGARRKSFKLDSISIGKGREEWGAEPGKACFVVSFSPLL